MKQTLLLLVTVLFVSLSYCQYPENFEGPDVTVPNGFPAGWLVTDNGVGTSTSWNTLSSPILVINGTKSAYINRHDIGIGNTSEDWLISPSTAVPSDGVLRFFTRQTLPGDNGTLYQIRVSTGNSQTNLPSYTIVQQWTEDQLNQIFDVAEEKVVNLPSTLFGINAYIAFVRVYTQPTAASGGDRWVIDDINVAPKCLTPSSLSTTNIAPTSANFFWTGPQGAAGYELEILPSSQSATGIATDISNVSLSSFIKIGLIPDVCYKYYVRSNCGNGNFSEWVGPFNFCTPPTGINCQYAIDISLPYQTINNTSNFGNTLAGPQTSSCISGGTNYQAGNDVFYSYTATEDCFVSFILNSNQPESSLFIYPSCAGITGPCLAAVGNTTNNPRILNLNLVAGQTYKIVVSSSDLSPTIGYNLVIQCENCSNKPTNLTVPNIYLTGADLAWTPPAGEPALSYQVEIQLEGGLVPSGSGQYSTVIPSLSINDLVEGNDYQYWVRSECAPGVFSAWVGPKPFVYQSCPKPVNLSATNVTATSASLNWSEASLATQWEVLLLAAPIGVVPSAPGEIPTVGASDYYYQNVLTTSLTPTLQAATNYYFYVRAICSADDKSAWSGPIIFNTITCDPADKCTYKFYLTSQAASNWSNGRMQVRQNGVVVATLGTGGVNNLNGIAVPICNGVPFDLYWSETGTQPQLIGIQVENSFGDTVYTKLPGEGTPLTVLYSDITLGNCMPPTCPKPQDNGGSTRTSTTAHLNWNEMGAATQWEVFASADGTVPDNNAPLNTGIPWYYLANTNADFVIMGLLPTEYFEFYVRAICSSTDRSTWKKLTTYSPDKIILNAFIDVNSNGIQDGLEQNFQYGNFTYIKNNEPTTYSSSQYGQFKIYDENPANIYNFNYEINSEVASYYTVNPINYTNISIQEGSGTQTLNFPITITQAYNDVQVAIVAFGVPRPGFSYTHQIVYKNVGHNASSGTITYTKSNANIGITSTLPIATTTTANGFTYDYTNLLPGQTRNIFVSMLVPPIPIVNLGDVVTNTVSIAPIESDVNLTSNSFTSVKTVVGSYDPNDKTEARGESVEIGQFTQADYLYYTIRFQNSGTASAETVRIEDNLTSDFDFASVRMISASHDYTMERINNKLVWTFNTINLPSEDDNEPGSHGYVLFKIKLNNGFVVGDVIENTAEIYFDFNPPIFTNTFETTFVPNLSTGSFDASNLVIYPNPAKEVVQITLRNSAETMSRIVIYDIIGKAIKTISGNNAQQATVNVSDLSKGVYMIEITTDSNLKQIRKFIVN
ncbi:DUF7619 domain-containing protein [Flavobacterium sp. SM2513]|uniref:DUF7619 domain-containing protein n=1 Tax=Flavobacterium sp. SM2513 TaxID=3424766 RepID=UPI003D7FA3A3